MPPGMAGLKIFDNRSRFSDYLLRRKGATKPRSLRLDTLPEDVLIIILSQCLIDDIFALRLTCSTFRDTFAAHSVHIVPTVARCTFPGSELLLRNEDVTFAWLKGLIPQQLAAILVDKQHEVHQKLRRGIPAEDPFGDELRARVANGWRVLYGLSNIAKEVYRLGPEDVLTVSNNEAVSKSLPQTRDKIAVLRQRENIILKRRLQYIEGMSMPFAQDYVIMFTLLSMAFRIRPWTTEKPLNAPWIFDFGHGIDAPRLVRLGRSWVTWFILHQGPQVFWEQWWSPCLSKRSREVTHVCTRALQSFFGKSEVKWNDLAKYPEKEWKDPNQEWHDEQRQFAETVQHAIHEKSGGGWTNCQVKHISYFNEYHRHRDLNSTGADTGPPIKDSWPFSVPFLVEFRSWERQV